MVAPNELDRVARALKEMAAREGWTVGEPPDPIPQRDERERGVGGLVLLLYVCVAPVVPLLKLLRVLEWSWAEALAPLWVPTAAVVALLWLMGAAEILVCAGEWFARGLRRWWRGRKV